MDIKFNCPGCGQHVAVDQSSAGMTFACPTCGNKLTVPAVAAPKKGAPGRKVWFIAGVLVPLLVLGFMGFLLVRWAKSNSRVNELKMLARLDNADARLAAVKTAAVEFDPPPHKCLPLFLDHVMDEDKDVRQWAGVGIWKMHKGGTVKAREAVPALTAAVRAFPYGENPARALGYFGEEAAEAVPVLIDLLEKGDHQYVAEALSMIGDKRAIPVFMQTLTKTNRSEWTRAECAHGLGKLKATESVDLLVKQAQVALEGDHDPNEMVKNAAVEALVQLPGTATDALMREVLTTQPRFTFLEPSRYAAAVAYAGKRPLPDGLKLVDHLVDPSLFAAIPENRNFWQAVIPALGSFTNDPRGLLPILERFNKHPWSNVSDPAKELAARMRPR